MILGLEIGMLIAGLLAVVRGRMELTPTIVAEGVAARLLGVLAMTPIPAAVVVIGAYTVANCTGKTQAQIEAWAEKERTNLVVIEACVVVGIGLLVVGGIAVLGGDPAERAAPEDRDGEPPAFAPRDARSARPVARPDPREPVVRCPNCDGGVRLDAVPPDRVVTCQWCMVPFAVPE